MWVFAPAFRAAFLDWDDNHNLLLNPEFRRGGWASVRWAWTTFHSGLYIPLTWMSCLADQAIWGMNPAGCHATNVVLLLMEIDTVKGVCYDGRAL